GVAGREGRPAEFAEAPEVEREDRAEGREDRRDEKEEDPAGRDRLNPPLGQTHPKQVGRQRQRDDQPDGPVESVQRHQLTGDEGPLAVARRYRAVFDWVERARSVSGGCGLVRETTVLGPAPRGLEDETTATPNGRS